MWGENAVCDSVSQPSSEIVSRVIPYVLDRSKKAVPGWLLLVHVEAVRNKISSDGLTEFQNLIKDNSGLCPPNTK